MGRSRQGAQRTIAPRAERENHIGRPLEPDLRHNPARAKVSHQPVEAAHRRANGKCEECLRRLGEHGCLSAGSLFQGRNKGARVEAHFAVAIEKAAILRQCEKRSPVKNPPIGLVGGQWAYLRRPMRFFFRHCRVFAPRAEIISVLPYIFAHQNRCSRNALTRKLAIAFGILTEVRHGYNHYANESTSLRRFR